MSKLSAEAALKEIQHALDGREWDAGDLEDIAEVLRRAGLEVRSPVQPNGKRTRLWDEDGICLTCGDLRNRCTGDVDDANFGEDEED